MRPGIQPPQLCKNRLLNPFSYFARLFLQYDTLICELQPVATLLPAMMVACRLPGLQRHGLCPALLALLLDCLVG